jgi:hypothetical protein
MKGGQGADGADDKCEDTDDEQLGIPVSITRGMTAKRGIRRQSVRAVHCRLTDGALASDRSTRNPGGLVTRH